jgi:hypothetical protein
MTVRQLLAAADSAELTRWQAFYAWEHEKNAETQTGRHRRKWAQ